MKEINLVHIYPHEMNIYGDNGNVLILGRRLEWRGFTVKHHEIGVGDKLPTETDIIVGGGGQDSGQMTVIDDLAKKAATLKAMADNGVVMLMICGMYQLFGDYFLTHTREKLPGIGYFQLVTKAGPKRLIGNLVTDSPFGRLIGYENHSGLTTLAAGQASLGQCPKGFGNNGVDGTEGALTNNVFGSYLHGPVLAKSPHLADVLLTRAIERRFGATTLQPIDNQAEQVAATTASRLKR